jgi:hypothetical protein
MYMKSEQGGGQGHEAATKPKGGNVPSSRTLGAAKGLEG